MRIFQIANNHHQQIVEVVGDAAGELSDGFHLLSLEHSFPRLLDKLMGVMLFGYIARHFGEADKLACLIADRPDHGRGPKL